MALLKRNIWVLFVVIIAGGVVLLSVVLHFRWQTILSQYQTANMNKVDISSLAIDSLFGTQELVLDLFGKEILEHDKKLSEDSHLHVLDNILSLNSSLVAFGLAQPSGQLTYVSSNLDLKKLPNLLTDPNTKESFELALSRNQMVVGRTYYLSALNTWVIPLRKAIRDADGNVLAVMTAGMSLSTIDTLFTNRSSDGEHDSFMLFREDDGFVQFLSREGVGVEVYTEIFVSLEQRKINRREFVEALGRTIEDIKSSRDVVHIETERHGSKYLTAASFNPRYQLWTVSEVEFTPLYREFYWSLFIYSSIAVSIAVVLFLWFNLIDKAERKRRRELLYLSRHDELTGLKNRIGLIDQLDKLIVSNQCFSLAIINIDNFRTINDRYGLDVGDRALLIFSRYVLDRLERKSDLARLSGDEFCLLMVEKNREKVKTFCESLSNDLDRYYTVDNLSVSMSASIGVAHGPHGGDSVSKLIRNAHLAIYKAKKTRNSICFYETDMERAYLRRLQVEHRLRLAVQEGDIYMVYQPQVDTDGRIIGLEALVRWKDQELGFVSPQEFIEVAEKTGLMLSLGQQILRKSIEDYVNHIHGLDTEVSLSINISLLQFLAPQFVDEISNVLREFSLPADRLQLEITESLFMDDVDDVKLIVDSLRDRNVRISMDDFGTGFSSLSLLSELQLDELKIDKSFVDRLLQDTKTASTVSSIIAIANSLGLTVIAEGIEEKAQVDRLISMGCYRFQGYYYHKPKSIDQIRNLLS